MPDTFSAQRAGLSSPAEDGEPVTPNDGAELANASRYLWVGGAGNVHLTTIMGTEVTLEGIWGGTLIPIRARKVFATGTTATLIVALW